MTPHPSRPGPAGTPLVAALLAGLALLTGCSSGGNTIEGAANNQNFIAGNKQVETLAADRRGEPVTLAGKDLAGRDLALTTYRGQVVVLNLWASWCGPCTAELPALQRLWSAYQSGGAAVRFVGVNLESADNGATAARRYGITYPSLSDPSNTMRLALQGRAEATPTTLVLDTSGRIAARISGEIPSPTTLREVVDDVVAESGLPSGAATTTAGAGGA